MADYNEMYSKFRLDEETKNQLNKFASRQFPFEECNCPVIIETIISDEAQKNHKDKVVTNAELV